MEQEKKIGKYAYRALCSAVLTLLATGLFFAVWYRFIEKNNQTGHLTGLGNLAMAFGIYLGLFWIIGREMKAFKIGVERKLHEVASLTLTLIVVNFLEIFISMAITGQFRFFWAFTWRYVLLGIVQAVLLNLLLLGMVWLYRRIFPPLRLLEIHGDYSNDLAKKVNDVHYKYHIAKSVYYDLSTAELAKEISKYDAVLINDFPSDKEHEVLKQCFEVGKRVYFLPKISDIIVKSSEDLNIFDTPLYLCRNIEIHWWENAIKTFFDFLISLVAIIILSPLLLVVALLIHLEDKGPVFFRQDRVTKNGKVFSIIKFRSMKVNAEEDGVPHPAGEEDPRITKVGKFIRATRIDELPQLFNILKGEMSLIGPRPERVEHVELYSKEIPEFSLRQKMKAGLTGYAQVYGKYNTTALDKLKLDLMYIMNYSLRLDVQILFATAKILFEKESTEGFSEEKTEQMQKALHEGRKESDE